MSPHITEAVTPAVGEPTQPDAAFAAVLAALEAPFAPEQVEFKPGATAKSGDRALALAYVDARVYQARLDAVAPDWRNEYVREYAGDRVVVTCALTVAGVTRQAIGECLQASVRYDGSTVIEENAATSAEAQAFKRACSAFGLGRYLYSVPQVWAEYDPQRRQFTPAALAMLREGLRTGVFQPAAPTQANGSGNGNPPGAAHPDGNGADAPACPKCGGAMWDNRLTKKNPRAPDYKCKAAGCDGVVWPSNQSLPAQGQGPTAAAKPTEVPF
jgi:hypothetical protein